MAGTGGRFGWHRPVALAVSAVLALGLIACSNDSDSAPSPGGESDELGFTAITQPEGDGMVLMGSGEDEVRLRNVDGFCDAYGRTRAYLDEWVALVEAGDPVALWSFIDDRHRDASEVADRISTNATDYHVGKRPSSAVKRTEELNYEGGTTRIADPIDKIKSSLEGRGVYDSLEEFETFFEDHC